MKVYHVIQTSKVGLNAMYLDREHLIEFLDKLPLSTPFTIGVIIDDSNFNHYECQD